MPFVATFAERLHHGLGVPVDDGQLNAGRLVGNAASLLPLPKSSYIETELVCKFLPAEVNPLAEGNNPAGDGINDGPIRQLRLVTDLGENLA